MSEASKRASQKYDVNNTVQVKMKLNIKTDADILKKLNDVVNLPGGKQGYIKKLIRKDLEGWQVRKIGVYF